MGITSKQRGIQMFAGGIAGLGQWMDVPFVPAQFTASAGMIWTVNSAPYVNRYCLAGNAVAWNIWVHDSTLSGTPGNQVNIVAPGKCARVVATTCYFGNGGTNVAGALKVWPAQGGNPPMCYLSPLPTAPLALGALQVHFSLTFEYGDPPA